MIPLIPRVVTRGARRPVSPPDAAPAPARSRPARRPRGSSLILGLTVVILLAALCLGLVAAA